MNLGEKYLKMLARAQNRHAFVIIIIFLVFTAICIVGATKVRIESDMSKEMPQELPIYQLNKKINDKFGGQDTIMIALFIDESKDYKGSIYDIRDKESLEYIKRISESIRKEPSIQGVSSAIDYLPSNIDSYSDSDLKKIISQNDAAGMFFSNDYKVTMILVNADIGASEEKIVSVTNLIRQKISQESKPDSLKTMITGTPPMRVTMLSLLAGDAVYTLVLAAVIILILLFVMEGSFVKGLLVFTPLLFGIVWTMGVLGFLGIKLSIATVGLGAMILGFGVEYGVFVMTRYFEEREKKNNQETSLEIAVSSIGAAVIGSGFTAIIGFVALLFSVMPMLQHLGASLGLGIFFCLIGAIVLEPVLIIYSERLIYSHARKSHEKYSKKIRHHEMMKL